MLRAGVMGFTVRPHFRSGFHVPPTHHQTAWALSAFHSSSSSSSWNIPKYVKVPDDQIEFKFVRSSGAGGQNVNKLSTCAQLRFHVDSATWMGPYEVRQRFQAQQSRNINKEGFYVIQAQEHRTQPQNRQTALKKLQTAILSAYPRPVVRKTRVGLSERGKERRRDDKKKHSQKKESRRPVNF